jgi:superfamily I DNA and/or RNA helicase
MCSWVLSSMDATHACSSFSNKLHNIKVQLVKSQNNEVNYWKNLFSLKNHYILTYIRNNRLFLGVACDLKGRERIKKMRRKRKTQIRAITWINWWLGLPLGRVIAVTIPTSSRKVMNKGWMKRVFGSMVIIVF